MPFCNTLSSYFLKLKSFAQFDGNSDGLKFCKLFRDIAHLVACKSKILIDERIKDICSKTGSVC